MILVDCQPCECGGPWALPDDARVCGLTLIATNKPDAARLIHEENCLNG